MTFKVGDKVVRINHGYGKVARGEAVAVAQFYKEQR